MKQNTTQLISKLRKPFTCICLVEKFGIFIASSEKEKNRP